MVNQVHAPDTTGHDFLFAKNAGDSPGAVFFGQKLVHGFKKEFSLLIVLTRVN
jgi:hypothetical protein